MKPETHWMSPDLPPLASDVSDACYCFPQAVTNTTSRFQLLCAGRESCLPNYHVSRSEYPYLTFEFVYEGKGRLRIGNQTHDHALYPGVLFSYGPGVAHDLRADSKSPMSKFFASYICHGQPSQDFQNTISPGQVRCIFDLNALQVLFEEMIKEGRGSGAEHRNICGKYLELILLKSFVAISMKEDHLNGGNVSFERTLAFIENHFSEVSSLAELAQAVGLSPTYICRIFRRFGRETPHLCIMRHKLNKAAELLVHQSTSIGQIAEQVGYHDAFHFSRLFKKRFGHSPKVFREMAGKDASGI